MSADLDSLEIPVLLRDESKIVTRAGKRVFYDGSNGIKGSPAALAVSLVSSTR